MMDAVEFLRERRRMCNAQDNCGTCPIGIICDDYFVNHNYSQEKASGMVSTVEQWAKEHPVKTRQSEFLKHYPDARILAHGCLNACPMDVFSDTGINCNAQPCFECKKAFWLAEAEK